jgi:Arc/MetJ-type ribon-helix-helix transcriptional regulator
MLGMKLSVSLPDEDVAFIDEYAATTGEPSRSAVIHRGIALLRQARLENAYAEAWHDWDDDEAEFWDAMSADGIVDAAR